MTESISASASAGGLSFADAGRVKRTLRAMGRRTVFIGCAVTNLVVAGRGSDPWMRSRRRWQRGPSASLPFVQDDLPTSFPRVNEAPGERISFVINAPTSTSVLREA